MDSNSNIAVVGPTGVVARELLSALSESGHAAEHVTLLGSERSDGVEVEYGGDSLAVEKATTDSLRSMKVVFFTAPSEVALKLAPAAQAAGAWVVDVSAAFLGDANVPVVVPAVNGEVLGRPFPGRIVRCPSAVTAALCTVLNPLRQAYGLASVQVTALMGSSSAGLRGVAELEQQTANLLSGKELEPGHFPHRLAFNLIPQVGAFTGASSAEELAWQKDAPRVLGQSPLTLDGTAIQVPTFFGHALSLMVKLGKGAEVDEVRAKLSASTALKVLDAPGEKIYPLPSTVTADPTVHVGRVRAFAGQLDTFLIYAVIDNAGRGAALNALEVATRLTAHA